MENHRPRSVVRYLFVGMIAVFVLSAVATGRSKDRHYETGSLLTVKTSQGKLALPIGPGGRLLQVPGPTKYEFIIAGTDVAYQGSCWAKKTGYHPEWSPKDEIEYRVEKDQIFVKRQKGREQPLLVELRGKNSESMTIASPGRKQTVPECL